MPEQKPSRMFRMVNASPFVVVITSILVPIPAHAHDGGRKRPEPRREQTPGAFPGTTSSEKDRQVGPRSGLVRDDGHAHREPGDSHYRYGQRFSPDAHEPPMSGVRATGMVGGTANQKLPNRIRPAQPEAASPDGETPTSLQRLR